MENNEFDILPRFIMTVLHKRNHKIKENKKDSLWDF